MTEPQTGTEGTRIQKQAKQERAPRFRTAPRAMACSAGRVRWAYSLPRDARPPWLAPWDRGTCAMLARHGGLEALKWARANGCDWNRGTCARAAQFGHLGVLHPDRIPIYARPTSSPRLESAGKGGSGLSVGDSATSGTDGASGQFRRA